MAKEVQIDSPLFYQKVDKIYSQWQANSDVKDVKGLLVVLGKCPGVDHQGTFSEIFHLWLIEYLFTETVILFTKSKIIFLTTRKLIDKIQEPAQYQGPKIMVIERDKKDEDIGKYEELMKEVAGSEGETIQLASFVNDSLQGTFPEKFLKFIKDQPKYKLIDASNFFESITRVKLAPEQDIVRKCGKVLSYLFVRTISLIEKTIDDEATITHKQISDEIIQFSNDSEANKYYQDNAIDKDVMEIPRDPLIQSGGVYSLSPIKPNETAISADVVLITHWITYRNYLCSASRTLLIDATEEQKKTYKTLLSCFQLCTSQMTIGTPLKQVYNKGMEYVKENDPSLLPYMPKSFGNGIGCKHEEKSLEITSENDSVIASGMAFELKIGLEGLSDKKMKFSMLLSDTILITGDPKPREILTGAISKAFKDISYSISAEEEEAKKPPVPAKKPPTAPKRSELDNISWEERKLRTKDKPHNLEQEVQRKQHQMELLEQKRLEFQERFNANKIQTSKKESELKTLTDLSSYDSPAQFPSEAKQSNVYVDAKKESLLVPVSGRLIPFHISTIKNVSKTEEAGTSSFLRINFHVPGGGAVFNSPLAFPEAKGENFAFLKEITIRISDPKSISNAYRVIKELIKRVKTKDQERKDKEGLVTQKMLVQLKTKRPVLNDVTIRPNISGKKTIGMLEGHTNGLRFISTKNEKVDIIYENIKHAFYQPCENELIVLVHFHLYNPIMVGNKKAKDIQFYSEVGLAADDLDMRRRNAQDVDEIEQENRERQMRAKLNAEFKRFSEQIEQLAKVEFDIPYRELAFFGVPLKTNVLLMPTLNCLVNLTEVPFFVISLADIEVAYFERVNFSLRNFDVAFIFKDLTNFVRIACIPAESLESIKDWLNEVNILFSEGTANLNWTNLLAEVRENPDSFLEFLQDQSVDDEEEEKHEEQSDSNFEPEAEVEDDDYSEEEEEESEYSEEEEKDEDGDEELEEEGMSWDELEQEALKQDKNHENKYRKEEKSAKPKKRSKNDD